MLLFWGSKGKSVVVGPAGRGHCPVCGENRSFTFYVSYVLRHMWFVLRWPTGVQHLSICDHCGNGQKLDKADFESRQRALNPGGEKGKSAIPFFDRFGWAMSLGAIALLILAVVVTGQMEDAKDAEYAAAPRGGDLYIINMQQFLPGTSSNSIGSDYGVVRVARTAGDSVTLDLPTIVSSRLSGAQRDARGPARADVYYNAQMDVKRAEIVARHTAGAIIDIERP